MKKLVILIFYLTMLLPLTAQQEISGLVTDNDDLPIIGANVFLSGTYDGSITDVNGLFSFQTNEVAEVKLEVSYLGYSTLSITGLPQQLHDLKLQLRESAMTLDAVEITASTFKAGDNSKLAVLDPLEILTTAGSMGDVIAAMQTLPGTQTNADDGRLFVRGGDARETAIYIDGLRVFSPYLKSIGGTPTRGRYSPLLFKGVSFSTGGYSSSFGQALSSVLDMNSIDEPKETVTNINLMSIGLGLGHTQKWDDQSLSINASYTDLSAYNHLLPSRINWRKPFAGFSGEAIYRLKTKRGLLKTYLAGDVSDFTLYQSDIDKQVDQLVDVDNNNIYANSTYTDFINDKTSISAGISFGINNDIATIDDHLMLGNDLLGYHARVAAKTIVNDRTVINYGVDLLHQDNRQTLGDLNAEEVRRLSRNIAGSYVENDYFFNKDLAIKTGLRVEYNALLNDVNLLPRITIAQKLSRYGQLSASYGRYDQEVDSGNLLYQNTLGHERAEHYIVNYSKKTDKQILRLETYYKKYEDLISYDLVNGVKTSYGNAGAGYAYGLDVFFRANQVVNNLDMWVSYSWLENERKYQDYKLAAPTRFSTRHNMSLVGKYFIVDWKSQLSFTYNFASGRPFDNPNNQDFLSDRSKNYHALNLSWSYLISPQKILFLSVNNVTRFRNSYGYEYKSRPNELGVYEGRLVRPNDDQFFFVGFFITMSKNKLNNQLNNL